MTPTPSALPTSAGDEKLANCPFCRKPVQFRKALWPSDGNVDAIIHAAPTECPMRDFSDGTTDESIITKWNTALRTPAPEAEALKAVMELYEWKSAVLDKCKASDGFDSLKWGGNKEGWGFIHYFIGHLETRALHAETVLKEQDAALSRPPLEAEIIAADKAKPEASFDNAGDMLAYLNDDSPLEPGEPLTNIRTAREIEDERLARKAARRAAEGERAGVGGREALARIIEPSAFRDLVASHPAQHWANTIIQNEAYAKADATFALPSQPPADRAAIVEECAKVADNFETGRNWSADEDMQNQAYYTEGEVASEIADAIRALAQPNRTEET